VNDDGEPDVVIRRTRNNTIYTVNDYSLVKGRHDYREGYHQLFPNEYARREGKQQGITMGNYTRRMARHNAKNFENTGQFNTTVIPGRVGKLNKEVIGKIQSQKMSLLQGLRFFALDLCWKAFLRACKAKINATPPGLWAKGSRYLLPLYGKASTPFLKSIVFTLGGLTEEEIATIGPDKDNGQVSLSQFIKGKGQC
jgi:hypothetical protein